MSSSVQSPADVPVKTAAAEGRRHIRGSSLLFAGRIMAQLVNFGVHVLIVRYLSESAYGAFAYALSIVKLGERIGAFGLQRAISRFVPIYHERQQYNKMFGTMTMVIGTVLTLGCVVPLLVILFQHAIAERLISDQQAVSILVVLIFLSPVEALDRVLVGLFAVFASARAIFFRRYVVGPALKLAVVVMLIVNQSGVYFLAVGYLAGTAIGVAIYAIVLYQVIRRRNLLEHFNLRSIEIPWREVLLFTTPLLTTDLVYSLMNVLDVVLLEHFGNTADVAAYRAVQPVARLNQTVFLTFALLYTPLASRLYARHDRAGINNLYWQTAAWIAVVSFPVFLATFSLAQPLTVTLFSARYEQSGSILALLAFGYYFNAALGFNGTTLTIYRKIRYVMAINLAAAVINVTANLLLIPRYGALGAAMGTCGTLVAHNIMKQAGLLFGTGINVFEWRYLRIYLAISLLAAALLIGQFVAGLSVFVSLPLAGCLFFLLVRMNRELLDVRETFPEIMRLPFVSFLLGK